MRDKIRLVSSAGTGYFYTTDKNKRTMPGKMEIKKYDPKVRKHVMFKEAKIKAFFLIIHIFKVSITESNKKSRYDRKKISSNKRKS